MLEAILVGIIDAFLLRKTMQFCSGVDTPFQNNPNASHAEREADCHCGGMAGGGSAIARRSPFHSQSLRYSSCNRSRNRFERRIR